MEKEGTNVADFSDFSDFNALTGVQKSFAAVSLFTLRFLELV